MISKALAAATVRAGGVLLLCIGLGVPLAFYVGKFVLDPGGALVAAYAGEGEMGRLGGLLARTFGIAALSGVTALGLALGIMGMLEGRIGRRIIRGVLPLAFVPLFLPGHFLGIAWIQTFGNAGWGTAILRSFLPAATRVPDWLYSPAGCAALLALHYYPVALAILLVGRRGVPAAAIDASDLMMRPAGVWRTVVLGWMKPWLAAAWLLVFILSLLDYSIPALLRTHVFTVEIMSAFDVYYEPARALALALPLLAVSLAAAAILGMTLKRTGRGEPGDPTREMPELGLGYRTLTIAVSVVALVAAVALPIVNQIWTIRGWGDIATTWSSARRQAGISVVCAAGAAAMAMVVATLLAAPPGRIGCVRARWLDAALLACFALPGSLVGMAELSFWNREWSGGFYDSGWMLPAGLAMLFLPVGYAMLRARMRETPMELGDLERLTGEIGVRRWAKLTLPRLARPGIAAAALIFMLALQEVHATILLAAPGQETLSVRAMTLLHYAPEGVVAAFCLIVPAVIVAAMGCGWCAWSALKRVAGKGWPDIDFD